MKSNIITGCVLFGWLASLGICLFLSNENLNLRSTITKQALQMPAKSEPRRSYADKWGIFDLEDMNFFRNEGKTDGKIEAILLMNKYDSNIDEEQASKIIELAEKSTTDSLSANPQFLSLLCRAAYHKGMASAQENNQELLEEEYERGYHKAIDDFTCPETGNTKMPSKKELDLNKPKK